jgi:ferritin
MIDQESANALLSAAAIVDTVAMHFKAAKYQMESQYSYGVAAFLRNEAMELWHYAGKIRRYVIKHEAAISDMPAQAAVPVGPADIKQCLESLKTKHKQAGNTVVDIAKKMKAAGYDHVANFMFDLYEHMQKDYQEVAKYANLTTPGIHGNLLNIDSELCEKYGHEPYANAEK